jgi:hypothetical protein
MRNPAPDRAIRSKISFSFLVVGSLQFLVEPGLRIGPVAIRRPNRDSQGRCSLLDRQSSEVAQVDEGGDFRLFGRQTFECGVEFDQACVGLGEVRKAVESDPFTPTAVLLGLFAARGFDEDAAHGFRGGGEEVPATVPAYITFWTDEAHVRLVDERGGGERVAGRLGRHPRRGELPQFFVDNRQKIGGGASVAGLSGLQKSGHFRHAETVYLSEEDEARHGSPILRDMELNRTSANRLRSWLLAPRNRTVFSLRFAIESLVQIWSSRAFALR